MPNNAVLWVDDRPDHLLLAQRFLEHEKRFSIVICSNLADAQQMYADHQDELAAVIVDVGVVRDQISGNAIGREFLLQVQTGRTPLSPAWQTV